MLPNHKWFLNFRQKLKQNGLSTPQQINPFLEVLINFIFVKKATKTSNRQPAQIMHCCHLEVLVLWIFECGSGMDSTNGDYHYLFS
jgi:hypothetical protein